jgi:hypothetical protein
MVHVRPQADPILVGQLQGEEEPHARWRDLTPDDEAAAVAELRTSEGGLRRSAGADEALIPQWIEEGRRRIWRRGQASSTTRLRAA